MKAVPISRRQAPFSCIHSMDTLLPGWEAVGFEPLTRENHLRAMARAEWVPAWARVPVGMTDSGSAL